MLSQDNLLAVSGAVNCMSIFENATEGCKIIDLSEIRSAQKWSNMTFFSRPLDWNWVIKLVILYSDWYCAKNLPSKYDFCHSGLWTLLSEILEVDEIDDHFWFLRWRREPASLTRVPYSSRPISLTTSLASQSALEKSFVAHRRLLHNFWKVCGFRSLSPAHLRQNFYFTFSTPAPLRRNSHLTFSTDY